MKFQSFITCLFITFSMASMYGCAHLTAFSAAQEWSENYALAKGVQANDPAMIDGNVKTVGQSQYVESSSPDSVRGFSTLSESVITLPEPKSIHRVVIHSTNLDAFDLWVTDAQGRWEKIKEIKSNKEPVIDLRLNRTVRTSGIRVRVHRTSDDAEMRRKNVQAVGVYRVFSGKTHALAQIAEVELYGFVPKRDAVDAPSQKAKDGKEIDDLLKF